ncbi:ABC transporter permease [Scatolibacter rhodanostii]|uniref:ABC transporter permease n=1 Tax=Scatolibacter rhodanostii TaxID=2014781 RepID=UPI000C08C5AE|nr:ABC transporter permease [Scatolibacter rhodanostii]
MKAILKRIGITVLTLLLVSLLAFTAFHILPGDPASLILGTEGTPEQLEALREELGVNRPLWQQYFSWISGLFTGQLGNSIRYHTPITALIADRLPITFTLSVLAIILVLIISFPLALLAARKENGIIDKVVSAGNILGMSTPDFFTGIVFIWLFGLVLKWFTPGKYIGYQENIGEFVQYLIFPALAIAIPASAMVTHFLRSSLIQELQADYVRTAYSRGASKGWVLTRHALKNAMLPAVTMLGIIVGSVFSGSIIIEKVFTIPGVGQLLISSITSRDLPLVQTLVVYIAGIVVIANSLVDIVIQIIDPRIRIK